jgi:hypothetical protein
MRTLPAAQFVTIARVHSQASTSQGLLAEPVSITRSKERSNALTTWISLSPDAATRKEPPPGTVLMRFAQVPA